MLTNEDYANELIERSKSIATQAKAISQDEMIIAQIQSTIALAEQTVREGGEHTYICKKVLQGLADQNLYGARAADIDVSRETPDSSTTLSEARRITENIKQALKLAESDSEFANVGKELLRQYQERGLYGKRNPDKHLQQTSLVF